jgi:hypothetical protein
VKGEVGAACVWVHASSIDPHRGMAKVPKGGREGGIGWGWGVAAREQGLVLGGG